jgi:pyruvate,orthophosphate dikinase
MSAFAYDSYRRFIQMYSDVVLGVDHAAFEEILDDEKDQKGCRAGHRAQRRGPQAHRRALQGPRWQKELGKPFPKMCRNSSGAPIGAVFGSWHSPRANTYRKLNNIPEDWGTASRSGHGVRQSRREFGHRRRLHPRSRHRRKLLYGEFLINAQGEDVVAGIRTPQPISETGARAPGRQKPSMEEAMPKAFAELKAIGERLEQHYRDMQDVEFTVQEGKLFMLQTRAGKRTAEAALKAAVDMEARRA